MNQKKKKIIIISSSIAVVCIILIMLLILIFTGAFKSNKEKFFQYAGELINFEDGFVENSISNYFKKLQEKPYNTNGSVSVNVEGSSDENSNNCNITFSGMVDVPNNKSEQLISMNYAENVSFPFIYRQVGNLIGLQTDSVSSKFVAIDTENFDELVNKLQGDSNESINVSVDMPDLSELNFSKDEMLRLQHTYIEPVVNMFDNDRFEKVENDNLKGLKLRLTGGDFKNIITTLLQNFENDQQTLDKLNATIFTSNKLTQTSIEQLLQQVKNEQPDENFYIEIIMYGSKDDLNKIQIQNESFKLELQKNQNGNGIQYNITLVGLENGNEVAKFYANTSYTGIQLAETVTENYEIGIETSLPKNNMLSSASSEKMKVNNEKSSLNLVITLIQTDKVQDSMVNNNTNESSEKTITKEDLEEELVDEDVTIETTSDENISVTFNETNHTFEINSNGEMISEPEVQETDNTDVENNSSDTLKVKYSFINEAEFVDSVEIEDLVENENCLILNNYSSNSINKFLQSVGERIGQVNEEKLIEAGINENPFLLLPNALMYSMASKVQTDAVNTIEKASDSLSEAAISTFNSKFEMYKGTNIGGATVKGLLSTIQLSNATGISEQIEEINFKGEEFEANEQNIATIKNEIQTSTIFKVEFEKNEKGIIYRVVINERGEGTDTTNTNETSDENTSNTTGDTNN